jgi:hypothetical protein
VRQEDLKLKVILGYTARTCIKKEKNPTKIILKEAKEAQDLT